MSLEQRVAQLNSPTASILVTGGSGYIGSYVTRYLLDRGCSVLVLDDLSNGHADAVPEGLLVQGKIGDAAVLDQIFAEHAIDAVMNFASFIEVGESVSDPAKYYRNNVGQTTVLLEAMARQGVQHFVFSSTAAIFGNPVRVPIDEAHPQAPINPYGRGKWLIEQMLPDYDRAHGLRSVCLRYFNAAGADPEGRLGERHDPETHLIPLVLQAASGRRESISIFGTDYDTPDGTCVRDYIHIHDLAQAHWLALEHLRDGGESGAFNLGNGNGFSIREVIDVAREVTGRDFPVVEADRRPGDPAVLVADSIRARSVLGWQAEYPDLASIIEHAWAWELKKGRVW